MAKRADITEDKILSDYQEALNMAKKQEKPADIVNAATAQAKLVGLLRDRQEIGEPGDFDDMENISDVIATVEAEEGPEAAAMLLAYASKRKTTQRPFNEVTEVSETSLVEAKPASDAVN